MTRHHRLRVLATIATAITAITVAPASGPAAAQSAPGLTWRTTPAAPIAARDDAAGVWTGSQLIVWGGDVDGRRYFADGAAYDPSTRHWIVLPKSPLSARSVSSYVWTGRALIIWGGSHGSRHLTDGALYDPATKRWTTLPTSPVGSYGWAGLYRVGPRVVLLSTGTAESVTRIRAASYDPATNTWTRLPARRLAAERPALGVVAVPAGGRLFVFSEWSFTYRGREGGGLVRSGVEGVTLDPASRTWRRNQVTPPTGMMTDQPLWTGRRVLLPALDVWCGFCPGPYVMNRTGGWVNPRDGKHGTIKHGPVDDLGATYVWTGSRLLGLDTTTETSGGGTHTYPGAAAAWNPRTHRWTSLPHAPLYGGSSAVHVWTGKSEIIWGRLYTRSSKASPRSGIELVQQYVR